MFTQQKSSEATRSMRTMPQTCVVQLHVTKQFRQHGGHIWNKSCIETNGYDKASEGNVRITIRNADYLHITSMYHITAAATYQKEMKKSTRSSDQAELL